MTDFRKTHWMNFIKLEIRKKEVKVGENRATEMNFLAFFSAKELFIGYSFER